MRLRDRHLVLALVCTALACGTGDDRSIVIASPADAEAIVPNLWRGTQGREYTELMFDRLADLGAEQVSVGDGAYRPRLATGWTWAKDSLSIAFHLDPRARWHDGKPVVSRDVQFAFAFATDTAVRYVGGSDLRTTADSVTTPDSLTAVVWFKGRSSEQFHRIAYNLVPLPAHLLAGMPHTKVDSSAFAKAPVGNGPFIFVSWEKGARMELRANRAHPIAPPRADRLVFVITNSAEAAARAVLAGDADVFERFGPDDIAGVGRAGRVAIQPEPSYNYSVITFNTRAPKSDAPHPVLASTAARRALSMAVNRAAIEKLVLDTLGRTLTGPFVSRQWTADTTLRGLPFDTVAAARALDSLGWHRGTDGARTRGGQPISLTLIAMSTSATSRRFAESVQQALERVGIHVAVEMLDRNAFGDRYVHHDFDLAQVPWTATPSPTGAIQVWSSRSYTKIGAGNAGGWVNRTFDAQADSAAAAATVAEARRHYSRAYQAAIDDPPAIWMYEPANAFGWNRRVRLNGLADRPDAWWMSIPAWDVSGRRP